MSHLLIRFQVNRNRAAELEELLHAQGAQAVTWENAGDDEYFEAAYPQDPSWKKLYLTGLFDSSVDGFSIIAKCNWAMDSKLKAETFELQDENWEQAWLTRFKPKQYRGGLWVYPSWVKPQKRSGEHLVLDPGLAFGTGDHPTTAMCLDWISEADMDGKTIIDYGCGSGILAIAGLKRGAEYAWGVDVDPRAVEASESNAKSNGVLNRFESLFPVQLSIAHRADIVVANILSDVIIELSETLKRCVKPEGYILLTGILRAQRDSVISAFDNDFQFDGRYQDQWCFLSGRKN